MNIIAAIKNAGGGGQIKLNKTILIVPNSTGYFREDEDAESYTFSASEMLSEDWSYMRTEWINETKQAVQG